ALGLVAFARRSPASPPCVARSVHDHARRAVARVHRTRVAIVRSIVEQYADVIVLDIAGDHIGLAVCIEVADGYRPGAPPDRVVDRALEGSVADSAKDADVVAVG